MRLSVFAITVITVALGGCIAEEDKTVTDEQGSSVSDPTLTLNGFWDGVLNKGASSEATIRVLLYNGNLYGLDDNNGYYGTTALDNASQKAAMALTGYGLSASSDSVAEQYIANGAEQRLDFDVQLSSLTDTNDSLFGGFNIDGTPSGNVELTRDGTWTENSPLSKLTVIGKWTASGYEMVMTRSDPGVTFTGVATDTSGCKFTGSVSTIDVDYNLYRVNLSERSSCPDFNKVDAEGYAGFNSDGDLEMYLRKNSDLLFMVYSAPAGTATDTTETTTETDDTTTE